MTVQTNEAPIHEPTTWVDDEIDLRRYLLILIAWWREIVVVTFLVSAVACAGILYLRTQADAQYSATANVVMAVLTSQIQIDERVQTTVDTQMGTTNNDRRNSLLALIKDGAVVQAVLDQLHDQLPSKLREPEMLTGVVEAETATNGQSNVISINVQTTDPTLSALIANTWADAYTKHINQLYGEIPPSTIDSVREELATAQAEYTSVQAALEAFVADNRLDELNRLIAEKATLLDSLNQARTTALTTIVNTQSESAVQAYTYLAKRPINVTIGDLNDQETFARDGARNLRRRQVVTQIHLERARNLERELIEGGAASAPTTARSLQLLKDQIYASGVFGSNTPETTSITILDSPSITIDAATQLADVRSLIATLEIYYDDLTQQVDAFDLWQATESSLTQVTDKLGTAAVDLGTIDENSSDYQIALADAYKGLVAPDDVNWQTTLASDEVNATQALIASIEEELQGLRAALEAETSRRMQLTQERDLAWSAYDALSNKLVELRLVRTSSNSILRAAGPALAPSTPVPPDSMILPLAAVMAATFLGMIIYVFLANSLGVRPWFSRRQAALS